MSDLLTALRLIISGDSAGAVAALEEVEAADAKLGKATDDLAAKNAAAAAAGHKGMMLMAGGAGLVVAAIGACAVAAGKQEEAVIQVQKMTGLSAKGASQLTEQMQTLGIQSDSVAPVLGRALKNAQGFADGATKSTSAIGLAFTDLGLSVDDLKGKNADQVLQAIREQIDKMPAGMQRTADIMAIFGRSAMTNQGLLRYLTASNSQLNEINAKAKQFGLIFTQKQLDSAAKFGEMLRLVQQEFKGLAVQVGTAVIPALTDIIGVVEKLLEGFQFVCNLLGPLKGVFMVFVVSLPGILLFAIGAMKVVKAIDTLRESTTLMNAIQAIFKGRMAESTIATEANAVANGKDGMAVGEETLALDARTEALLSDTIGTEANTAAVGANSMEMLASLGPMALVAAGIAADIILIDKAVRAYQAMEQAEQQAAQAQAQFKGNASYAENMIGQKYGANSAQEKSVAAVANATTNKAGVSYTSGAKWDWNPLSWWGEGGSFHVSKPTVIGVGEKGDEDVFVVPGSNGRTGGAGAASGKASSAGAGLTVSFAGANFYGAPTPAMARVWAPVLMQVIGEAFFNVRKGGRG